MCLSFAVFEIAGYLLKVIPPAYGSLVGGDPAEFHGDLWYQKTRVPGLSYGVVCVILHLAVLVELRLVTDTGPWLVPRMRSITR